MISVSLAGRDRRMLIAGAATIISLFILARGIPAWRSWIAAERAAAVELSRDVARSEADIAALATLRDSLRVRQGRHAAIRPTLIRGANPSGGAATLAAAVSEMAEASSVRLGAIQVGSDTLHAGVLARVWVRGDASGDVKGIAQLLLAFEQGPELLAIRELSITQSEPGAPSSRAELLRASFLVEGLTPSRQARPRGKDQ